MRRWITATGRLRPASIAWMAFQAALFFALLYFFRDLPNEKGASAGGVLLFIFAIVALATGVLTRLFNWVGGKLRRSRPVREDLRHQEPGLRIPPRGSRELTHLGRRPFK